MTPDPLPDIRKEVQDYLRACEHLISAVAMLGSPPFSKQELDVLEYYATEISKLLARSTE